MTAARLWIAGARPRTLTAAVAPVLVGTALAGAAWQPLPAVLALVVALALQIGVNYANDYGDGIRGTDDQRLGPVRLVGQGLARPHAVRTAALICFAVAATAGVALVAMTGHWWLLMVGAAAIAAAWLYTGGPRPYGYLGLGEVFVFVFFGPVPVLGTMYVQAGAIDSTAVVASIGVGFLVCAILVANNLRDIPTDEVAGKHTLAVRLGDRRTRGLYAGLIFGGFAVVVLMAVTADPWVLIGLLAVPFAVVPVRIVLRRASGPQLVPALVATGKLVIVYAVAVSVGLVVPVVLGT